MFRGPDTKRTFQRKEEAGQNPYCGFVSFQHFRDEALYSDIVVRPENNGCETENVETYPIPAGVPQDGRAEGWYPDTTVVYIRVLWKDFEPKRGEYNLALIRDILDRARRAGQTVMFRLLPHSTCARDDVPDWLKELIPCPERPDGMRVKASPTDPLFYELFLEAIRVIGRNFDQDPVLDVVDISTPGCWGEGFNREAFSDEMFFAAYDTYLEVFPNTHLIGQLSYPEACHRVYGRRPLGVRCDGLGQPWHTDTFIPKQLAAAPQDAWKYAPVSFESFWWITEWLRRDWDLDAVIEKTLSWHISTLNPKSLPMPYGYEEKIRGWIARMGYHFALDAVEFPSEAAGGDTAALILYGENTGVAPTYRATPLTVSLVGAEEFACPTETDIRRWLPGAFTERVSFRLPAQLPAGEYEIRIGIGDAVAHTVYLATDAPFDGERYTVGRLMVR